jgi:Asp-tRNA(Asn)/Glu-tRNA(Gln) amidotransferase A subunit family amidase
MPIRRTVVRVACVAAALLVIAAGYVVLVRPRAVQAQAFEFHLLEATIGDVHRAIQGGQITCRGLVQAYVNRARAYNGVSNKLVTEEMAPEYLPDYAEYKAAVQATASLPPGDPRKTPPIEFGRMEPTASDPDVQQQYGMIVGIPNAGQLRALGMLNIRGERSVTCKGAFDRPPSEGAQPAGAPAVCEEFRKQPDALERAAELDAQYGRAPDLAGLPMYCIPFSFKDPYDTKDIRSTGGADARYDIDFPARDQTLVAQLRAKGAIIYAKANTTEYNGGGGNPPGGKNFPAKVLPSQLGYQRSTWAGNPSNPYDTSRAASLGSSSGSGVSVGANLAMCSLCEETGASCRGPANHNSVALVLPHKGLISFHGGSIGASIYQDRAGIHCRSIADSIRVLDALKDPVNGYYDPRDIFTTVPRSSISTEPYSQAVTAGSQGALKGMRIGIIREFMIEHAKADEPIVDAANAEMKTMLAGHLGATLVESVPPGWADDPEVENMTTSFDQAIAAMTPVLIPEVLYELTEDNEPLYPAFAARIEPTTFAPGVTRGSGTMQPVDWMRRWADGLEPHPPNLNVRTIIGSAGAKTFRFHMTQYMTRRAGDWADRGFTETLVDFPTLNARSKFWRDSQRAAFKNWEEVRDLRNELGARQGIAEQVQRRELLRRVIVKVIQENRLDILIQLHSSLPPGRIGLAAEPSVNDRAASYAFGPNAGITEILIPAGYVRTVYDPAFELATDRHGRKFYRGRSRSTPTTIPDPGLPFSINFLSEPGMEHLTIKAASAYQAASRRRVPPPAFGPVEGEP